MYESYFLALHPFELLLQLFRYNVCIIFPSTAAILHMQQLNTTGNDRTAFAGAEGEKSFPRYGLPKRGRH